MFSNIPVSPSETSHHWRLVYWPSTCGDSVLLLLTSKSSHIGHLVPPDSSLPSHLSLSNVRKGGHSNVLLPFPLSSFIYETSYLYLGQLPFVFLAGHHDSRDDLNLRHINASPWPGVTALKVGCHKSKDPQVTPPPLNPYGGARLDSERTTVPSGKTDDVRRNPKPSSTFDRYNTLRI